MEKKSSDSKWLYMVLSLVVSACLWMYVTQELNPDQTSVLYNIPVVFSGVDDLEARGLTLSAGEGQTVTLTIQAKRDVIQQIDSSEVSIVIDLSAIQDPGDYSVTDYSVTFPRAVSTDPITVRSRTPSTLTYTVSKWVEREIEVRGTFSGSVAEGFQMGDLSVSPSTITILGLEELVEQVDYARVTVAQDELADTYIAEVPFSLMSYTGEVLSGLDVELSQETVKVTLPVVTLKEIPLTIDIVPGGGATLSDTTYTISPASIIVSGQEDALEPLSEITLGSVELYKIFGTDTYSFKIPLAEELTNVSGITEATVTVSITGLTTKTLEVDNIELINVPDGYTATSVTESRSVMIRGDAEAVEQVISSQLRIVANMEEASATTGTQTIPVTIYLDGSSDVGVVGGDYYIVVSISQN